LGGQHGLDFVEVAMTGDDEIADLFGGRIWHGGEYSAIYEHAYDGCGASAAGVEPVNLCC
jgi:hypothetical protein